MPSFNYSVLYAQVDIKVSTSGNLSHAYICVSLCYTEGHVYLPQTAHYKAINLNVLVVAGILTVTGRALAGATIFHAHVTLIRPDGRLCATQTSVPTVHTAVVVPLTISTRLFYCDLFLDIST